jgi:hypothetical protein
MLSEHQVWSYYPFSSLCLFPAGAVRAQELYGILQEVLLERDLDFMVAPYSAGTQVNSSDRSVRS